ncbi:MAG: hypothetical protein ACRYGG_06125 [Janthinobacterium lividum]
MKLNNIIWKSILLTSMVAIVMRPAEAVTADGDLGLLTETESKIGDLTIISRYDDGPSAEVLTAQTKTGDIVSIRRKKNKTRMQKREWQ